MGKAEYRSAIRSRKLINAALADLLQEKPLEKITVTDIVNRAEINRGTFYAHYADIPDVINHLIEKTFFDIRQILSKENDPVEKLPQELLREIEKILSADMDFYQKIMNSNAAPLMHNQLVEIVVDYMLQQQTGLSGDALEAYEISIRFCAGGISNLYSDWFAGKLSCSLRELTQAGEKLIRRIVADK